jgi:arylsulfatase
VVDLDYEERAPYAFTGTLRTVVFDLKPAPIEEEQELHRMTAQAGAAHGAAG